MGEMAKRAAASIKVSTRHGPMWVFAEDKGCSKMLQEYGEYSEGELAIMKLFISPESTVLDVGAHIGAFTIPLARLCKKVYACEAQEEVQKILEQNINESGLTNIEILPFALGFQEEIWGYTPQIDSLGSTQLQATGAHPYHVQIKPLDSLGLNLDFIKLDVEGMELHVIAGGRETVLNQRPTLFFERSGNHDDVIEIISRMGYINYNIDIPIFASANYNGNKQNLFPNQAHKMNLALFDQRRNN